MTWEWLRKLCEVWHELHTIKICFQYCKWRNNLCQSNTCKNAPEAVLWIKKILRKNEINVKLNTAHDFIREIWGSVRESRTSMSYLGDPRIIQESWYIWKCFFLATGIGKYLGTEGRQFLEVFFRITYFLIWGSLKWVWQNLKMGHKYPVGSNPAIHWLRHRRGLWQSCYP